jgi:hypothetical protein
VQGSRFPPPPPLWKSIGALRVGSLRKSLPLLNKVPLDGCVLAGVIRCGIGSFEQGIAA